MRTIIAGSRDFADHLLMAHVLEGLPWVISSIISGRAKGADLMGEQWAQHHGIPLTLMPADWNTHGKAAGPLRNRAMAEVADACVLFWDGSSRGTANMMQEATARRLRLVLHVYTAALGPLNPRCSVLVPPPPPVNP